MNTVSEPVLEIANDGTLQTRSWRRSAVGVGVSLLVHAALLLLILKHKPDIVEGGPVLPEQSPITLLLPPTPITPDKALPTPASKPKKRSTPKSRPPVEKPSPTPRETVATAEAPPTPTPPVAVPEPTPAPATDMTAMIEAARERRRAAAGAAAPPEQSESDGNEIAKANIQHSMRTLSRRRNGASGIFQILDKGVRRAQFSFHGWTPDSNREISQLFEVDAGTQGDIDRAIVRKMIELIRKHYAGDFNWDSHRLGRVVVLSARLSDNEALEAFLLREFFS